MAKRDVELVITAKDRASATAKNIAEALAKLSAAQEKAGGSAQDVGGLLGKLGAELDKLAAKSAALTAFGKVSADLEQGAKALARLEGAAKSAADDQTRLKAESEKLGATMTETAAKTDAANASLAERREELRKLLVAQNKLDAAVDASASRLQRLRDNPTGAARLDQVQQAREKRVLDAARKQQAAGFVGLNIEAPAVDAEIQKTKAEIAQYALATEAASKAQAKLGKQIAVATTKFNEQEAEAAQARTVFAELEAQANSLGAAVGGATASLSETGAAAQRVAQQVGLVTAALREQKAAADQVRGIQGAQGDNRRAQQDPVARASGALARQNESVDAARAAFAAARDEVNRFSAALEQADGPALDLAVSLEQAKARAAEAYAALLKTSSALPVLAANLERAQAAALKLAEAEQRAAARTVFVAQTAQRARANIDGLSAAFLRGSASADALNLSFRRAGDGSRTTLSLMQRLRGEVLAIAAATIGLYNAFDQLGQVVAAFRTLEAAESRLGAVFDQDGARVARELRFVEQQADRLGISFGVLSDEYSKFVIAAEASNFTSEATRKIFLSTAEAGRVNKLSLDNLQGVFLALTQIISKGTVSSEELRRQLGDRLPGAFNLFADSLGVSAARLDELLRAGEVLADEQTLLNFAATLDQRFGAQLPKSLETTTTQLERLTNAIFKSRIIVGESSFITALTEQVVNLNKTLESEGGRQFFETLGNVLAALAPAIGLVVDNFESLTKLGLVFLLVKIGAAFSGLFAQATPSFALLRAGVADANRLTVALRAVGLSVNVATARFTLFGRTLINVQRVAVSAAIAFRRVVATLGGIPGILATVAAIGLTEFLVSGADAAGKLDAALDSNEKVLLRLKDAFAEAKTEAEGLAKAQKTVSTIELQSVRSRSQRALNEARADFTLPLPEAAEGQGNFGQFLEDARALKALEAQVRAGSLSVAGLRAQVLSLLETGRIDPAILGDIDEVTVGIAKAEAQVDETRAALAVLNGEADAGQAALFPLANAAEKVGRAFDGAAPGIGKFGEAIEKLQGKIPELTDQLKVIQSLREIDDLQAEGLKAAGNDPAKRRQVYSLAQGARTAVRDGPEKEALDNIAKSTGVSADLLKLLIAKEGGIKTKAYRLPGENFSTIGIGDTGRAYSGRKPVPGLEITRPEAIEDFGKNLAGFNAEIDNLITKPITEAMRAALLSLQFNTGGLGSKEGRALIVDPINRGDYVGAAGGISQFRRTTKSGYDLGARRDDEAALFASGGQPTAELRVEADTAETKRIETQEDFNAALALAAEERRRSAGYVALEAREAAILKAQDDARVKAAADKVAINQTQLDLIRESVGLEFDGKSAVEKAEAQKAFNQGLKEAADLRLFEKSIAGQTEREQEILREQQEALNEAKSAGLVISKGQLDVIRSTVGAAFDVANAERLRQESIDKIEESISLLEERRSLILEQIAFESEEGNTQSQEELKGVLGQVNDQLRLAIDGALEFYRTLGGPEAENAVLKLELLKAQIGSTGQKATLTGKDIANTFASTATDSITGFFDKIASGEKVFSSLGEAIQSFAANFLRNIAEMILQAALFKLVMSGLQAVGFGGVVLHSGGVVGSGAAPTRAFNPAWLATAQRYHSGGMAGLKPGEVPAILQTQEEVLSRTDPRNIRNGGAAANGSGGSGGGSTKIVNAFDTASFLENALTTRPGEKAILNFVSANSAAFKLALG